MVSSSWLLTAGYYRSRPEPSLLVAVKVVKASVPYPPTLMLTGALIWPTGTSLSK